MALSIHWYFIQVLPVLLLTQSFTSRSSRTPWITGWAGLSPCTNWTSREDGAGNGTAGPARGQHRLSHAFDWVLLNKAKSFKPMANTYVLKPKQKQPALGAAHGARTPGEVGLCSADSKLNPSPSVQLFGAPQCFCLSCSRNISFQGEGPLWKVSSNGKQMFYWLKKKMLYLYFSI